uniref:Secreted protein n=1 Tax=Solanum lycopersicum TaxID=4081 RepID=A0A3Q7F8B5_SOLLC
MGLPPLKPSIHCSLLAFWSILLRPSIARMKIKGESVSPCLSPFLGERKPAGPLLMSTEYFTVFSLNLIHLFGIFSDEVYVIKFLGRVVWSLSDIIAIKYVSNSLCRSSVKGNLLTSGIANYKLKGSAHVHTMGVRRSVTSGVLYFVGNSLVSGTIDQNCLEGVPNFSNRLIRSLFRLCHRHVLQHASDERIRLEELTTV